MKPYHWTKINEFFTDIDLQPLLSSAVMPDNQEKWGKKGNIPIPVALKVIIVVLKLVKIIVHVIPLL